MIWCRHGNNAIVLETGSDEPKEVYRVIDMFNQVKHGNNIERRWRKSIRREDAAFNSAGEAFVAALHRKTRYIQTPRLKPKSLRNIKQIAEATADIEETPGSLELLDERETTTKRLLVQGPIPFVGCISGVMTTVKVFRLVKRAQLILSDAGIEVDQTAATTATNLKWLKIMKDDRLRRAIVWADDALVAFRRLQLLDVFLVSKHCDSCMISTLPADEASRQQAMQ